MIKRHAGPAIWLGIATLIGCTDPIQPSIANRVASVHEVADAETGGVVTIDHRVPHVSTVPANFGEPVRLFVRERVRDDNPNGAGEPRPAVLMIHGRSVPVLAAGELRHGDYDWAEWLARSGGFDVFMLDFQGSGRSPRPKMDDPCNVPGAQQMRLLIPNPLSAPCPPSYPFTLNTAGSDLDELDAVVDFIRTLRGVDKVHLVGWSAGSFRVGPFAVQHPEKVASLLFFAPIFNTAFQPTTAPPGLPRSGTPTTLGTRADLFVGDGVTTGWDAEVRCEGQREAGIEDIVWAAIMENDELGRTWGPPPPGAPNTSPPEGLMRIRQLVQWGWNAEIASQITVPTLIIRGEFDTGQGGRQQVAELYSLVRNDNKLRLSVQCAGHFMTWERQRTVLHQASKEWIKHGQVGGFRQGEFDVDNDGNLIPM